MSQRLDITRRLQQRLLEIVRTALPLIPSSFGDADLVGLAHLRIEMVDTIEAYCRHVHRIPEACTEGPHDGPSTAECLKEGCVALRGAYDAFCERWEHRTALNHWYEYRLSAVVMMKQVRDHVRNAEDLTIARFSKAA